MKLEKELIQRLKESTDIKEYISVHSNNFPIDKANKQIICPNCKSGEHKDSAIQINRDNTIHCHACGYHADIFKIAGIVRNTTDFKEQVKEIARFNDIGLEAIEDITSETINYNELRDPKEDKSPISANESLVDYLGYYKERHKDLIDYHKESYLEARGIDKNTQEMFNIGYEPSSDRIILPFSETFYTARAVDPEAKPKYKNPKGARPEIYKAPIGSDQIIFLTEGLINCMSVFQAGRVSIALGACSMANQFCK